VLKFYAQPLRNKRTIQTVTMLVLSGCDAHFRAAYSARKKSKKLSEDIRNPERRQHNLEETMKFQQLTSKGGLKKKKIRQIMQQKNQIQISLK